MIDLNNESDIIKCFFDWLNFNNKDYNNFNFEFKFDYNKNELIIKYNIPTSIIKNTIILKAHKEAEFFNYNPIERNEL